MALVESSDNLSKAAVSKLLTELFRQHHISERGINLTPGENVLSPCARLPYLLDAHARYYLDDLRIFGKWRFPGGRILGSIEKEILVPALKQLTRAAFVNVRAISGINCMTIALAGLSKQGEDIFTVPLEVGGHVSTEVVAKRLGLRVHPLPFANTFDIDYDVLEINLRQVQPALVYIDQATQLFPIDPGPIRALIDRVSPATIIHYDSSHVNGLILGNAMFNPLEKGAHCFGGSTHKTLPGPHKGFLATNCEDVANRISEAADHFVSHHQMASIIALTITILEMRDCNGAKYARQVISNAKVLARALQANGFFVSAADRDFTECHQIWAYPEIKTNKFDAFMQRMEATHILANNFSSLPGIPREALRLSVAELTRLGAAEQEMNTLAEIMGALVLDQENIDTIRARVFALRERIPVPRYCFERDIFENAELSDEVRSALSGVLSIVQ